KNEWSYPYTVYYLILAGGIAAILHTRDTKRKAAGVLIIGSNIVIFIAVMMLTNLTTFTTVKYLLSGVAGAMLLWLIDTKERYPQLYHRYAMVTLIAWCGVATFVKGWAYPDNDGLMKNVTVVGNIIEQGPAKGILVEYMQGYITESTWEEFHTYVAPGDSLLVMDTNTLCVMYVEDVNVSNSTTICSPTFDENLLDYWERNPEKYPDVIAVQCWYGECKYDADTWMMQWIEDQFGASQVIDGKYFRYYIR
ncbi:MAG: hypothetical protein K6G23_03805, partial [Lachnospiraceae bacterium]|nr:hypothetical protein [Lachnospiraceae bacterium]